MLRERRFWGATSASSAGFVQHVLVAAGIFSLVYLLWKSEARCS